LDYEEFATRTEQLKKRLYRTALLYLGSESAAVDAVDEAVFRALRGLKKLRQPEYFDTWMFRILINDFPHRKSGSPHCA
jgi:RNA polymerase sigma-70 factor (ECF subfamily)